MSAPSRAAITFERLASKTKPSRSCRITSSTPSRRAILEAAEEAGLPLRVAPLRVDQPVEELYLCSTLKELAPVVGMPSCDREGFGPLGERLHAALRALIRRETGGEDGGEGG